MTISAGRRDRTEYQKNWWANLSPEKRREYSRSRDQKKTQEAKRHHSLKKSFGLTLEQYQILLEGQNGVCACCGLPETALSNNGKYVKALAVDHDHETGLIRGLICQACNQMIGHSKESIER